MALGLIKGSAQFPTIWPRVFDAMTYTQKALKSADSSAVSRVSHTRSWVSDTPY